VTPDTRAEMADLLGVKVLKVYPWHMECPPGQHEHGWDPRSAYVENYWLPILGPSTTWLIRRLADAFNYSPEGFEMDVREMAKSIGLTGARGTHDPFNRAMARLISFEMARLHAQDGQRVLMVRRKLPPLNRSQVKQLPASLAARYEQEVMDQ
jgi:hypothetical protein